MVDSNTRSAEEAQFYDAATDSKGTREKPLGSFEVINLCELRGCNGNALKHVYLLPLFQVLCWGWCCSYAPECLMGSEA